MATEATHSSEAIVEPISEQVEQATSSPDLEAVAPGGFHVIRRNGKVTGFDVIQQADCMPPRFRPPARR